MWKAIGAAIAAALIVGGIVYWVMQHQKQPVVVNVDSIKNIAQLATIEYRISTALPWKKPKKFPEWKEAMLIVFAKGKITGSVDLQQTVIDIFDTAEKKLVKIEFKKGAIVVSPVGINEGDLYPVTCSDPNIFHRLNDDDTKMAQDAALKAIKEAAIKDGIESKTAVQAKLILTNFLQGLGYKAEIEFEDKSLNI